MPLPTTDPAGRYLDPSAQRADARANRARLIEAAHAVFREHGPEAEMKEIAERAGVGIGTIYRNFPTKDDLVVAVFGEMIDGIAAAIEEALAEDDPVEGIYTLLRQGFAIAERFGDMAAGFHKGSMPPACAALFQEFNPVARVAALLHRGIDVEAFRADLDEEIAAVQLISAFQPWFYQTLRSTRSVDQLIEAYAVTLLHGILATDGAGDSG